MFQILYHCSCWNAISFNVQFHIGNIHVYDYNEFQLYSVDASAAYVWLGYISVYTYNAYIDSVHHKVDITS